MLRERLAYSLWREMGVPAPRSTHINVKLETEQGSQLLGIHLLTEAVDGRFTKAYFEGGDGNLYKEAWPGMATEESYVLWK